MRQQTYVGFSNTGKSSVRVIQFSGTTDVTKNMFAYEYCISGKTRDILVVDAGIGFPDPDMYGIDLVIPDVRYLERKKEYIRGIVFTHGHDDHIGAIPYIYPKLGNVPLFGTPLTAAFANVKLKEAKLKVRVKPVEFTDVLTLGVFRISFVRVTHSIPDTSHLIIETPVGIFYHGSDYKFDSHPLDKKVSELEKIRAVGEKGVLCVLADCLGSERIGFTPSEGIIGDVVKRELSMCPGKFLFTTQSSNISRIQLAIDRAFEAGRTVAFVGRSIIQNVDAATSLSYMRFPRDRVVTERDLRRVPPPKQFLVVAGAQGQPDSALSRIAFESHQFIHLAASDTVFFSADPIPGNENAVSTLIDQLYRSGARVSYTDITEDSHVSGHGSQGDHMLLLSSLGPSYVYPIGGTYKHIMNYQATAVACGFPKERVLVPEEGDVLDFQVHQRPRIVETLDLENVFVDGLGVGDVGTVVLHDRKTIAEEGIVVIIIPLNRKTGKVVGDFDIISRGFVYMKESGELMGKVKKVISETLYKNKGRTRNWRYLRELVEDSVQNYLKKETGRQPLILPVVLGI
jgi:ribonuclease J